MKRNAPSACLFALAMLLAQPWSAAGQAAAHPLDARLGGIRESFEAKYGEPSNAGERLADLHSEYEIKGYSTVFVSYHEGLVTDIDLFAPRPEGEEWTVGEEWTADEAHERNWTTRKADELARRFLPRDVEIAEPYENVTGVVHIPCSSDALAEAVPAEVYAYVDNDPVAGQCEYGQWLDPEGRVAWISLTLQEPA